MPWCRALDLRHNEFYSLAALFILLNNTSLCQIKMNRSLLQQIQYLFLVLTPWGRRSFKNCWKLSVESVHVLRAYSHRSRLGHKPDYRLGWSSEYVRKSMYACRSVSVACRPAEKRRQHGKIGSIHRSILVGHRRPNRRQGVKKLQWKQLTNCLTGLWTLTFLVL